MLTVQYSLWGKPLTDQKTRDILAKILRERTGTHFLDSGGYAKYDANGCYVGSSSGYGRHWERNRCRDFDKEPYYTTRFYYHGEEWYFEYTINLYHFLLEHLEYNEEWDQRLHDYAELRPEDYWHEILDDFWKLMEECWDDSDTTYIDIENPGDNSSNYESNLSQVIQWNNVVVDDEALCVLQIHQGSDVRGGYAAPRVFSWKWESESYFSERPPALVCSNDYDHIWYIEDERCRKFEWEGKVKVSDTQKMLPYYTKEEYERQLTKSVKNLEEYEWALLDEDSDEEEFREWHPNIFFIDDDGNGYCPICGGMLES
jgi:hypothetical protein